MKTQSKLSSGGERSKFRDHPSRFFAGTKMTGEFAPQHLQIAEVMTSTHYLTNSFENSGARNA